MLVFESKDFCNNYIYDALQPRDHGIISLAGYLKFWAFVFLGTTVLIALFKKEKSEEGLKNNPDYGIKRAYPILWKIIKLKPVMQFSFLLFTVKASFAAVDAVTTLKLIEYGLPKDKVWKDF